MLPGWTFNDGPREQPAGKSQVVRSFARLLAAAEECENAGAKVIFTTPFPRDAKSMPISHVEPWRWLRREILSLRNNGETVLGVAALLGSEVNGKLTGTYLNHFTTDNAHPNDHGHEAIADLLRVELIQLFDKKRTLTEVED